MAGVCTSALLCSALLFSALLAPCRSHQECYSAKMPLFGQLNTHIVGRRHYSGTTECGEHIDLRRDPCNCYDSNAIAAYNRRGEKVGHIPRWLAAVLAPCADRIGCAIQGKDHAPTHQCADVHSICAIHFAQQHAVSTSSTATGAVTGAGSVYATPICVSLYAPPGSSKHLCSLLSSHWQMWQLGSWADTGGGSDSSAEPALCEGDKVSAGVKEAILGGRDWPAVGR
ncbi:hypothetical protein GQ54DRAFT_86572 [Martensiomyces pterosporus]|nr:hypothetical protein GQ54DRAFT_86572 [Martensiomyces pterosporus]